MCGRYVSPDEASIEREFNLVHHEWQFPISYNVAPTQSVPVVRIAADGQRTGALMHWGLISNDQQIFGFAGLWDRSRRDDGTRVASCAIITMPASDLMSEIHNAKQRMPAILAREDRDAWLKGTAEDAFAALKQYPDARLVATPVSTRVNAPKNNDPTLIECVAA